MSSFCPPVGESSYVLQPQCQQEGKAWRPTTFLTSTHNIKCDSAALGTTASTHQQFSPLPPTLDTPPSSPDPALPFCTQPSATYRSKSKRNPFSSFGVASVVCATLKTTSYDPESWICSRDQANKTEQKMHLEDCKCLCQRVHRCHNSPNPMCCFITWPELMDHLHRAGRSMRPVYYKPTG